MKLQERLRRTTLERLQYVATTVRCLVNPDGPEAAAQLDLYEAALREADDTLRKLAADLAEEGAELHAQRIAVIELSVEQIDAALNSTDTGA